MAYYQFILRTTFLLYWYDIHLSHGSSCQKYQNHTQVLFGHLYFRGRKFRDFRVFWPFSRKFLPSHILNSKLAKVCARKITEILDSRKFFPSSFFRFFNFLRCCSLITPIFSLLGRKTKNVVFRHVSSTKNE